MSEENKDIRPAENTLDLIEIVPGYRETRSTAALDKALIEFHKNVKVPKKTGEATVPKRSGATYSYRYVELPELLKAIDGPLGAAGLVLKQPPFRIGNAYGIMTILSHPESGEKIISGPFMLDNEKGGVQGAGGDITYARRYCISAVLGLAWDDDDDGQSAQGNCGSEPAAGQQPKQQYNRRQQNNSADQGPAAYKKDDKEALPYKVPFVKDKPTAAQINGLEVMCQYVGRKPADLAKYYKVGSISDMQYYTFRKAYKTVADILVKKGYTQGPDLNWYKKEYTAEKIAGKNMPAPEWNQEVSDGYYKP